MCTLGFLAIWLIIDLSDNGPDFIQAKASLKVIAGFYLTQLPAIVIIVLPVGLLLALLFSLSKMSRTNELIAQLTAGRSVIRILLRLFGVGFICTGILAYLNYELAPHADSIKKLALEQIQKGKKKAERDAIEAHLFRDRQTLRSWYIQKMRPNSPKLENVVIVQQDAMRGSSRSGMQIVPIGIKSRATGYSSGECAWTSTPRDRRRPATFSRMRSAGEGLDGIALANRQFEL
jgi:lipopolysaccharide export LptBFGC system permease protein LptF